METTQYFSKTSGECYHGEKLFHQHDFTPSEMPTDFLCFLNKIYRQNCHLHIKYEAYFELSRLNEFDLPDSR